MQERERAVKAMEVSLQAALDQAEEKERRLDDRIAEIARLETRLHEALQQYTTVPSPPAPAHEANNWDERDAALSLQEQVRNHSSRSSQILWSASYGFIDGSSQELALTRQRIEDREKHVRLTSAP
jgi:hypothetical protein